MNNFNKTSHRFCQRSRQRSRFSSGRDRSLGAGHDYENRTARAPQSYETQVRNAEVVYVEGNDLVLKLDTGKIEHLVVPDSRQIHDRWQ